MAAGRLKVTSIELDDPDPVASRERLLDNILADAKRVRESCFMLRFRCDLLGSSHWDGGQFVLDVRHDRVTIRMLDGTDLVRQNHRDPTWRVNATKADSDTPQGLHVDARETLTEMTGSVLAGYLYAFMASDVLGA